MDSLITACQQSNKGNVFSCVCLSVPGIFVMNFIFSDLAILCRLGFARSVVVFCRCSGAKLVNVLWIHGGAVQVYN